MSRSPARRPYHSGQEGSLVIIANPARPATGKRAFYNSHPHSLTTLHARESPWLTGAPSLTIAAGRQHDPSAPRGRNKHFVSERTKQPGNNRQQWRFPAGHGESVVVIFPSRSPARERRTGGEAEMAHTQRKNNGEIWMQTTWTTRADRRI